MRTLLKLCGEAAGRRPARPRQAATLAAVLAAIATVIAGPIGPAQAVERGFELVTPSDGGFYHAVGFASKADGTGLYWKPAPVHAGDPAEEDGAVPDYYLARRTGSGWPTEILTMEDSTDITMFPQYPLPGMDTDGIVYFSTANLVPEDQNVNTPFQPSYDVYRVGGGVPTLISAAPFGETGPLGAHSSSPVATGDLSTVLFASWDRLLPDDGDDSVDLYLRTADSLELISRNTDGTPHDGFEYAWIGDEWSEEFAYDRFGEALGRYVLAADGSAAVFFTDAALDPADTDGGAVDLYLWEDGEVSLVSGSVRSTPECDPDPCAVSVEFDGMTPDANHIYFATTEQLTDDDTDTERDVYEYRPDALSGALRLATGGAGDSARTVAVSSSGALFFQTAARIGSDPPPAGANDVIYRWDGATIRTVTPLAASGSEVGGDTGSYSDTATYSIPNAYGFFGVPTALPAPLRQVRVTGDGEGVYFATEAQLVPSDTDERLDAYLWREGEGITHVSAGGNTPHAAVIGRPGGRGMSADGSRLFFTSADALTPDAGDNGRTKVYVWEAGELALVSPPGVNALDAFYIDNSESGDDVFFRTRQALVPSDHDGGEIDVYDARVGGGFPEPAPPAACANDGCQGPGPDGGDALRPGTSSFRGAGNLSPAPPATARVTGLSPAVRRKLARRGVASVMVRVSRPGRVTLAARARIAGRWRVVATSSRRARSAGTVRLGVRLSKSARRTLAGRSRLGLTLSVRLSGQNGSTTRRLILRRPSKAAAGRH